MEFEPGQTSPKAHNPDPLLFSTLEHCQVRNHLGLVSLLSQEAKAELEGRLVPKSSTLCGSSSTWKHTTM